MCRLISSWVHHCLWLSVAIRIVYNNVKCAVSLTTQPPHNVGKHDNGQSNVWLTPYRIKLDVYKITYHWWTIWYCSMWCNCINFEALESTLHWYPDQGAFLEPVKVACSWPTDLCEDQCVIICPSAWMQRAVFQDSYDVYLVHPKVVVFSFHESLIAHRST